MLMVVHLSKRRGRSGSGLLHMHFRPRAAMVAAPLLLLLLLLQNCLPDVGGISVDLTACKMDWMLTHGL
jgi:hypothetical protein